MGRGARLAVVVPAIGALVGLAVAVVPWGVADWRFQPVRNDLRAWAGAGKAPNANAWEDARAVLEGAVAWAPGNPSLQEYLGRLHLTEPALDHSPQEATTHLVRAVEWRPTAPYPWILLLAARYQMGLAGKDFERMLVPVWRLAPSEPGMQRVATDLGLAMWHEMDASGRAVVTEAVAAGMRRSPSEVLTISQRRGRLFPACAHVPGEPRLAGSAWPKTADSDAAFECIT